MRAEDARLWRELAQLGSPFKNRSTGHYHSTVTITNISGGTLAGDRDLALLNLTAGVTLADGNDTTACDVDLRVRLSTLGLAAGNL